MTSVHQQGRRQYRGTRNLMRDTRLLPPLAEDDGRLVGVPGQHADERERRVECRPRFDTAMLEPVSVYA